MGIQASSPSPWLSFKQSLPQRNHHFPCPASPALLPPTCSSWPLHLGGAQAGGCCKHSPKDPHLPKQESEKKNYGRHKSLLAIVAYCLHMVLLLLLCLGAWSLCHSPSMEKKTAGLQEKTTTNLFEDESCEKETRGCYLSAGDWDTPGEGNLGVWGPPAQLLFSVFTI